MASDWLAMIFLGADNDLFQYGDRLMEELKRVGSTEHVTIVAERDPTKELAPTVRGLVRRGLWKTEEIGVTAGDAEAVLSFVQAATDEYPAEKKLLILWDHGNGWQNVHAFERVATEPEELETVALASALAGTLGADEAGSDQRIDVLCFDSCLNAMIEIAFQLRGRVSYMVASENVVPADSGWPYVSIMGMLNTHPQMEAGQAARAIVGAFAGAYNDSTAPVTLSALDLAQVEGTVEAIADLSRTLIASCRNGDRNKVLIARRLSQSFGNPDYVDLISFCTNIERLLAGTATARAAAKVREKSRDCEEPLVIGVVRGNTASINDANGVSIYFPERPVVPQYALLDFPHRSGWGGFLAMITPEVEPPAPFVPKPVPPAVHHPR